MLYYRCISAAIEPDRISLLLLNILSLAGKHQQKTNNLRSWQAKFLPSVWFKTEMLCCLQRTSPIYASWNNDEKSMMQSLLSHPEHKENIQKPDAKSRNSPGQCLGITQDFRTTVDNVASHKVSHKRSWQCSLLLRWEWTDRHSPLDVCLLVLIKKRRARKSIQSCSWSSTNHKNSSLQLSQIDSHLCAVAGFPHPDLVGAHRTDDTADLSVLFRLQVNGLALVVPSFIIVEFSIFYPGFKPLCWRLCWCSWEVFRGGGRGWSLGWFKLIQGSQVLHYLLISQQVI